MSYTSLDGVLLLAWLSSFALFVLLLRSLFNKLAEGTQRKRRIDLVDKYSARQQNKRSFVQISEAANLMSSYGNSLIKDKYRNRLETLLITSGDWEIKNFSGLAQRKVGFAVLGFALAFLFVLTNNLAATPVALALVVFGYFLPNIQRFGNQLIGRSYKNRLVGLLDGAGSWREQDYLHLVRKKLVYGFFGFVGAYLYVVAKSGQFTSVPWALILIAVGFFVPDILLQNKVSKRKMEIADTLPDAIDMLQMCVSAGLALPSAMTKVSETQKGPVAEEFSRVLTEVQLGKSRTEAFQAMSARTGEKSLKKFSNSILQIDTFGIPVTSVLVEQSKQMRSTRRESAREQGQKVPVKILGPIMLCFLPCVIAIVLGPAAITAMKAFS